MKHKKKWITNANESLQNHLKEIGKIINPLFENNGVVDLTKFEKKGNLEDLIALTLNCKFVLSEDKNDRRFGVDDVIALKLEVEENRYIKYWGKIYWLSKPNDHECFKSYQDPFYGLFKLENNQIVIEEAMFGDYNKNDLDGQYWIESEMNWMYDI